jgi:hypothetical protein
MRTLTQLTEHRAHHNCDALQLQLLFTGIGTWTQRRLAYLMLTRRANSHDHDSLNHTLPDDDLHETPGTALGTTSPINDHPHPPPSRRQRPVAPSVLFRQTAIVRRLADDGIFTISTRSLRQPMVARPEALVRSPPRGKRSFKSSTSLCYQLLKFTHGSIT